MAPRPDISLQRKRMQKALSRFKEFSGYSHMDFIWSLDAARVAYPTVLEALKGAA
jgi:hypothetical protein